MSRTLAEIAQYVDGTVAGDSGLVINNLSGIKEAQEGDLTFVANAKYFSLIDKTKASACIAPRDLKADHISLILVDNPSLAFAKVAALFMNRAAEHFKGIHETALIAKKAKIGKDVHVGPYTVIEDGACIGAHTVIYPHCYVGRGTTIGENCLIYSHVSIRERITIGRRVIIHSGTVIGSDGFGFVNVQGVHEKIPQMGTVEIADDVEIGANVAIDRARFDKTVVGRGTKIDNLVQIAHNVRIGEHCIIVAQVGISGSDIIENNAILAGQAGLAGHLTIGEGAVVMAQAGVTNSVAAKTIVSGYPAKPHHHAKRVNACVQRLPHYVKTIKSLQERIDSLEKKIEKLAK